MLKTFGLPDSWRLGRPCLSPSFFQPAFVPLTLMTGEGSCLLPALLYPCPYTCLPNAPPYSCTYSSLDPGMGGCKTSGEGHSMGLGTCATLSIHQRLQNEQAVSLPDWHFIFLSLVSTCSAASTFPCSVSVHPHHGLLDLLPGHSRVPC